MASVPRPGIDPLEPYKGLPGCKYCGLCINGCMVGEGLDELQRNPRSAEDRAPKDRANGAGDEDRGRPHGRATGVSYLKGGREFFQPAELVILATYVYENTRLLLLSKSKAYPKGLSNNSGQVGMHYISHMYAGASGLFPGKRLNLFSGPGAQRNSVDDWNGDNFDHKGLGFIGGAIIDSRMENKPIGHVADGTTVGPAVGLGMEGSGCRQMQFCRRGIDTGRVPRVRGELPRPRPDRQGP